MNNQFSLTLLITILLTLLGLYVSFSNPDERVFSRKSEARTSVVAREMIQKNDYLLPTINESLRLKKPPLYYWMIAGFSNHDNVITHREARLPSVIAGLLVAVLLAFIFSRYYSYSELHSLFNEHRQHSSKTLWAILTGLLLIAMPGFLIKMRNAEAETLLAFFTLLSMTPLIAHLISASRWKLLLAYAFSGIGFLAKGPILLAFVWPAYYLIRGRKLRHELGTHLLGVILMLILALSWFLAIVIYVPSGLDIFLTEIGMRFQGSAPHQAPLYYYLYQIIVTAFPLSLLLPFALIHIWKSYDNPHVRYVTLVFLIGLSLLTVLKTKQMHYLLPLFPIMSLVLILYLRDLSTLKNLLLANTIRISSKVVVFVITMLMVLLALLSVFEKQVVHASMFFVAAVTGFYYLFAKLKQSMAFFTNWSIYAVFCILLFLQVFQQPIQSHKESQTHFISNIAQQYKNSLVVSDLFDSRLFYYYGKYLTVKSPTEVMQMVDKENQPVYVISKDGYQSDEKTQALLLSSISGSIGKRLQLWQLSRRSDVISQPESITVQLDDHPAPDKTRRTQLTPFPTMLLVSLYIKDEITILELFRQLKDAGEQIENHFVPWKVLRIHFPDNQKQSWLNIQYQNMRKKIIEEFIDKYGISVVFTDNMAIEEKLNHNLTRHFQESNLYSYKLTVSMAKLSVSDNNDSKQIAQFKQVLSDGRILLQQVP